MLLGIYAGLVPSIQYYIIDRSHTAVHGNTGCFLALAIPTFCFWPLPLLHGRKPYILAGLAAAMPLIFPQAITVNIQRLDHTAFWKAALLVSRTLMGAALGFASMNCQSILTDLFGASLMCRHPHQEVVDLSDARRHGGGMGMWLGIWTWCWLGSLGLGFLIGACIINTAPPVWGFYVSIILVAVVIFMNILCPEVRRSPYRRSVAEVQNGSMISRRIARGEVTMHRMKTGPRWWGQEAYHGMALSLEMLRQPGFLIMAMYCAWIYAQVVLIIMLLGSVASRLYNLRSPFVGLAVGATAFGALLAIPFQKASLFSRVHIRKYDAHQATLDHKFIWSSHLLRRSVFTALLPIAGICYTTVSSGPPITIAAPVILAFFIGFLSSLAIAECNGIIMEAFDTSDLQPGLTGHHTKANEEQTRTNYSVFPRISAGFAIIHTLAFIFAAAATELGGTISRTLGQQVASGVMAGVLLLLTSLLLLVLIRFKEIQIIPNCQSDTMDQITEARRKSTQRRVSMPHNVDALAAEERAWQPVMLGNPANKTRRMNILELGALTRWQEIRKKNQLIDEGGHLNRAAVDHGLEAINQQLSEIRSNASDMVKRSRKLRRSERSTENSDMELGIVGKAVPIPVLTVQEEVDYTGNGKERVHENEKSR